MTADDGHPLPLLNQGALDRLREEVDDDEEVWQVFVRNFIDQLPVRTEKLRAALTTGDKNGTLDALLSLKTASQMVGAERLSDLALDLERSVRIDTRHADPGNVLPRLAATNLKPIIKCSQQTADLLHKYLHR